MTNGKDAAKSPPMTDEELKTIAEAVAWRVEAASKSEAGKWPDRAAVVGRMTYSAERLLGEVARQGERIRVLEGLLGRAFVFVVDAEWSEERNDLMRDVLALRRAEVPEEASE